MDLRCRARIHIGGRHYSGYLDNISRKGAKLTTIAPIVEPGVVLLALPDLPTLKCQIRWIGTNHAGVEFAQPLSIAALTIWVQGRRRLPSSRNREATAGRTASV